MPFPFGSLLLTELTEFRDLLTRRQGYCQLDNPDRLAAGQAYLPAAPSKTPPPQARSPGGTEGQTLQKRYRFWVWLCRAAKLAAASSSEAPQQAAKGAYRILTLSPGLVTHRRG